MIGFEHMEWKARCADRFISMYDYKATHRYYEDGREHTYHYVPGKNEAMSMAKSAILQKEFRNERKMLDVSYRMFRFMANPKQALIAEAKRLVRMRLPENLNQFMNMDHMFIMRLAALLLAAALPAVCFRENPGCHMSCSCCWYLQKQLSHMPLSRTGGGSCFRVSFPYFFVFLSKEGQKAERAEKPCSPFTLRTGQLSDIITGSPISLSMEEPVPARPNP